ncbi:MAG: VOC family protein [Pleomorphochaeta sp.]
MEFKQIDHITINVTNLEKSLWFYGDLLNLEKLPDIELETEILHYFQLPGNIKLELTEFKSENKIYNHKTSDKGIFRHLAFSCTDAYAVEKKLTQAGFPFHIPVSFNSKLGFHGGLTRDPNGVELEFLQY